MSADAPGIRPFRSADLERIRQITVESFEGVSIDRNIEAQFGQVAGRDWRERKARDVMVDCEVNPEGVFVAEIDGEQIRVLEERVTNGKVFIDAEAEEVPEIVVRDRQHLAEDGFVIVVVAFLAAVAPGPAV